MQITIPRPDDWHLHLRDDALMASVLPDTARQFARAIGTGVIGGMLTATLFAVFLVPVFFVIVRRFFPGHSRKHVD